MAHVAGAGASAIVVEQDARAERDESRQEPGMSTDDETVSGKSAKPVATTATKGQVKSATLAKDDEVRQSQVKPSAPVDAAGRVSGVVDVRIKAVDSSIRSLVAKAWTLCLDTLGDETEGGALGYAPILLSHCYFMCCVLQLI